METIDVTPKKKKIATMWIILAVVGTLLLWSTSTYNTLLSAKQDVEHQWAQVETQYHRRFDLIPNLVATVKGYMKHEQEILDHLSSARQAYAHAKNSGEQIQAASDMDSALSRLLVVVENYPNLKADQTVIRLMDEVAGTENRIAVERKRFNDQVRTYNMKVQTFPSRLVASVCNFDVYPYLKAPEQAAQAPQIQF